MKRRCLECGIAFAQHILHTEFVQDGKEVREPRAAGLTLYQLRTAFLTALARKFNVIGTYRCAIEPAIFSQRDSAFCKSLQPDQAFVDAPLLPSR